MKKYKGETKVEEQKISFWKRICISVKNVEKYQMLAGESIKKSIIYLLKIIIIFSLIVSFALTIRFGNAIINLRNFIEQNIEELSYKDSKLNIVAKDDLTYYINEISTKIIINTGDLTEEQQAEYVETLKYEFNGIMVLKDKVIIKNQMTNIPSAYSYSDIAEQYEIGAINKQDIIEKISGKNQYILYFVFFTIMTVYLFIIYFSSVLMDALVLAILGYITCLILKIKLKPGALYNIAIYALTLPIILNAIYIVVNVFTGFTVKYFQVMYTAISYIYVISSILIIKSDIIKKQAELTKILGEQEKVKEELAKKEQEEKEKEEKERIRKKDKQKEDSEKKDSDEKDKKNSNLGEQPEGTNA